MKVYAAWNKDKIVRKNSTSGGVFAEISEYVLQIGGYVCGAVVDYSGDVPKVRHVVTDDINVVKQMRGSKYVQSSMGTSFIEIKELLDEGKTVLFSGTPCQTAAIKNFVKENSHRLITVDILCHGVSSPLMFEEYCRHQQKQYNSAIEEIKFRYKKPGWTVFSVYEKFRNGEEYVSDKFTDPCLIGFLIDMYARRCCEKCPYTSLKRQGDITLADFWGYKSPSFKYRNNEKGISSVLINTDKGENVWNKISDHLEYQEHPVEDILEGNRSYIMPWQRNKYSEDFWQMYRSDGWEKASQKYCKTNRLSMKMKFNFAVYRYWYLIPKFVKSLYKAISHN